MKKIIRIILTIITFPLILLFGLLYFAWKTAESEIDWINFEWF